MPPRSSLPPHLGSARKHVVWPGESGFSEAARLTGPAGRVSFGGSLCTRVPTRALDTAGPGRGVGGRPASGPAHAHSPRGCGGLCGPLCLQTGAGPGEASAAASVRKPGARTPPANLQAASTPPCRVGDPAGLRFLARIRSPAAAGQLPTPPGAALTAHAHLIWVLTDAEGPPQGGRGAGRDPPESGGTYTSPEQGVDCVFSNVCCELSSV